MFAGSFTLEAAEAVCPEDEVFFGAARLREQSLLRTEDAGEEVRFRLLETLRDYGQEKLRERGNEEAELVAMRHARHFAEVAGREIPTRLSAPDGAAMAELVRDTDNFRAALDWLLVRGTADEAAAMVVALAGLWERQGRFREGRAYLTRCLERQTEIQDRSCIAVLLGKAGWFAYQEQDYSAACEQAERKLALCRDLGNAAGESSALNDLALIAQAQGYVTEAWERFEQALVHSDEQAGHLHPLLAQAMRDGLESQLEELREDIATYEQLRTGR